MELLRLVENDEKFFMFIRDLRIHPLNTDGFLEQVKITESQQFEYMNKHKDDYWVCLSGDTPVGFVGVVESDIRLAVLPSMKRFGVGTFMIKELLKKQKNIYAKVLLNNIASQRLFEKNNFINYKTDELFRYYRL